MLAPNTILQGRYRIIRQLGQGGMGTVYEAIDDRFESQVAIKETLFTDEALRKQFEREARLLNKLRHPAMTRVVDHFTEGGGQYLVMDFVPGEELAEMLKRQGHGFAVAQVLEWGDQLLDVLTYLHSQTPPIIHRDIKPQNLKLTDQNRIILLDFGLAKGSTGQMTTVATSHSVVGYSLAYAPLEQMLKFGQHWLDMLNVNHAAEVAEIQNKGTDARSDIYSLGATLLHLMTNRMPPNAPTRALAVWSGHADPIETLFDQNIPPGVADVLRRALALKLDDRFASAADMQRAIEEAGRAEQMSFVKKDEAHQSHLATPAPMPAPAQDAGFAPTLVERKSPAEATLQHQPEQRRELPATVVVPQQQQQQWDYKPPAAQPYAAAYPSYGPRKNYLLWIIIGVVGVGILVTVIILATTSSTSSNKTTATTNSASPTSVANAYLDAYKRRDPAALKGTLSRNILSQLDNIAANEGTTVDKIIQQSIVAINMPNNVVANSEQVEGNYAVVNVNLPNGNTLRLPLVRENGEWKVDTFYRD